MPTIKDAVLAEMMELRAGDIREPEIEVRPGEVVHGRISSDLIKKLHTFLGLLTRRSWELEEKFWSLNNSPECEDAVIAQVRREWEKAVLELEETVRLLDEVLRAQFPKAGQIIALRQGWLVVTVPFVLNFNAVQLQGFWGASEVVPFP